MIDLGLRLADVERLGLQSEEQVHRQQKDPTEKFLEWGTDEVTEEEAEFLRGESIVEWSLDRSTRRAQRDDQPAVHRLVGRKTAQGRR